MFDVAQPLLLNSVAASLLEAHGLERKKKGGGGPHPSRGNIISTHECMESSQDLGPGCRGRERICLRSLVLQGSSFLVCAPLGAERHAEALSRWQGSARGSPRST